MPYDELGNYIQGDEPSIDQMKYALAQRGSMPVRSSGSDVPYVASEVPTVKVPIQPKEVRPASSATNIVQALADKFGVTAIPQSVMAIARGFPAEVAKGMGYPELSQKLAYEPTSTMARDILAGLEEAPKAITGSSMGFGPIPELWVPKGRGVSPEDVRVMGANAKRVAGEVRDIPSDFRNAQSGVMRQNAFGEPTLGVRAQGAVESVAPVVYPKIEQFMENIGGLKRIDVGPSAKNWSKASEDAFKKEFATARKAGQSVDEANITAWKASQLNDVPEGAPGSLGTRYLPMTDKLVQETMLGELDFEPLPTISRGMSRAQVNNLANKASLQQFGVPLENLTKEQQVQLRDYLLAMRTVGKSANLPAVLEAYPDIANYTYEYTPSRTKVSGGFSPQTKAIGVVSPKREAAFSTVHELVHAIQTKEGLPQGANLGMFDLSTDQGKKYQNYVNELMDEKEALMHAGFMQKKARENNIPLADYIKQNNDEIDRLFKQEPKGMTSRELNVLNRMDELALKYTPEELEEMAQELQQAIAKNPRQPIKAYRQVFGEAHARNTESRLRMPFQQRREIFPESTLDVPQDELRYSSEQAEGPALQLKAEEKPKRQSKAEAEELGLYHPVGGGTKLKRPISEMNIQTMDNPDMPLVPRKEMKPEDMVGGAIIPLSMDLSSAGKIITGVGGKELIVPVKTQGGYQFMQWNGNSWSSLPNVSNRIGTQIQTAREMEGVDPDKIFGVTKTMSPTAVDFNHMTTEVLLNQFDPTTIPKPIAKSFNKAVRNQPVKNQNTGKVSYPFTEFKGIETPEGRIQLLEVSNWGGELRKNMIHKMGLKKYKEAGFPDVAEARTAISAPELLDQPIGMTGHGIARFDPSGEVILDPKDPHYTYTAQLKGHPTMGGYAGAWKTPISNEKSFPVWFDWRRGTGKSKSSDDRAFSMSMPIQKTNQEWLDTVMAEMEAQDRAIKEGLTMDEARLAIQRKEEEPKQLSPKDELGFYSNIEKAALNLKRQSGNGQAYLNDIKKQAGVHNDELEAIGLPKFLASKKTFTTPEVQEYIANNRLKLIETRFSTDAESYYDSLTRKILDEQGWDMEHAPRQLINEASAKAREIMKEKEDAGILNSLEDPDLPAEQKALYGPEDYPEYMTPGGQNYRELILRTPEREVTYEPLDLKDYRVNTENINPVTGQRDIEIIKTNEDGMVVVSRRWGFRGTDQEALDQYKASMDKLARSDAKEEANFKNGHYSDFPNTVLNMRLQDFRDVDGKRGTLIDELQSDWHQKGRDEGYRIKDTPDLKPEYDALLDKIDEKVRESVRNEGKQNGLRPELIEKLADTVVRGSTHEEKAKIAEMLPEFHDIVNRINNQPRTKTTGVPDAPYKERWHELGIKKAVIDSIKRGDDRIFMPEGKDVADRYPLSKKISQIDYQKMSDGTYMINAKDLDGNPAISKRAKENELSDLVGKDIAKKIVDGSEENLYGGTISGVDLDVGTKGMRKYYDEIYPSVLKKLAKQYGGKFGKTRIPVGQQQYVVMAEGNENPISVHLSKANAEYEINQQIERDKTFNRPVGNYSVVPRNSENRNVYYYEPSEEAKVKIQGGVAMKDGGAVHMREGGINLPDIEYEEERKPFIPPAMVMPYSGQGTTGARVMKNIPVSREGAINLMADIAHSQTGSGTNYNVREAGIGYSHKLGAGYLGGNISHRPGTNENRIGLTYAIPMAEGGNPADARQALFEANRKALAEKQAIEEANRPRTYAERLEDHYESGRLKRPAPRPSGMAGIAPSIEPSGNGGQILLNPLNRKDGGDVNLDAMRFALTKGK